MLGRRASHTSERTASVTASAGAAATALAETGGSSAPAVISWVATVVLLLSGLAARRR